MTSPLITRWLREARRDPRVAPVSDTEKAGGLGGGGGSAPVAAAASLNLVVDTAVKMHAPYTITGPATINVSGAFVGGYLTAEYVGNGTNTPTLSGAVELNGSFPFNPALNTRNFLQVECRPGVPPLLVAAWSQLAVNAPAPPAPAPAPSPVAPSAPATFTAGTAGSTTQGLNWTAPATGYPASYTYSIAYRVNGSGAFPSPQLTGLTGTSTTVTGLTASTSYDYQITATNTTGTGPVATITAQSTTAAPGAGEDAVTVAYRAAMVTDGQAVDEAHVGYFDTMVKAWRAGGILSKITTFNGAMNQTLAATLVPQIGSTKAAAVGTVTFDPALGWSTDGTSGRINTNLQAVAGNWAQGAYLRTDQPTDATTARPLMGSSNTTDAYRIIGNRTPGGTAGTMGGHVSNLHGTLVGYAGLTSGGLTKGAWTSIRRSNSEIELFKNGVSIALNTGAATVTTAASVNAAAPITVMALNVSPANAPSTWLSSGSRVAGYWLFDGTMSSADMLVFYNALQAFQTSMARQV